MTEMQELFDRDSLQLTDPDIDKIVEYYRSRRAQFVAGDKTAGKAPSKAKAPAKPKMSKEEADAFLDSLFSPKEAADE